MTSPVKICYNTKMRKEIEIRICGINDVLRVAGTFQPDFIISLVDPEINFVALGPHHTILQFHDVEHFSNQFQHPRTIHCLKVRDVLDIAPSGSKFLVHCHAGISRSTAMAIGMFHHCGMTAEEAINTVFDIRPIMWPNALIVEGWSHLSRDRSIVDALLDWKEKNDKKISV